ncbi:ABC transporter A family member 8 [Dichanthelium oligosanthes]|uniref:ABC transporter A family member 8 n=1 Tax=Dichanthelium oligosanthes TaxID=888268 RepID=A0A1E5UWV3_9POAL|nr:ABC transporter A family member 8 [Dichanthelium oligosanthes]
MESRRSRGLARFFRQVHALFLKNLSFQRRNARTNAAIAAFPVLLCVLLVSIQHVVDGELERPPWRCGCQGTRCGIQYSTPIQALSCAVPVPPRWPALVQVPATELRARTHLHPRSCNASENCPATVLYTGQNHQLAEGLGKLLFPPVPIRHALLPNVLNSSNYLDEFSRIVSASTAYLNLFRGQNMQMRLEYLKEMPKSAIPMRLDLTTLLDALFFTWTVQLLLPVILTYLVYEKEQRLRLMMKMHGLKDAPYWLISYAYFLSLSTAYIMLFMISGSVIGLDIFRLNSYIIQSMFYFICINLQIVLAFLLASFFSSIKTASVIGYIYVFGASLLGEALLKISIEDDTFPRLWLVAMELIPGFSLYRGIYELSEYAAAGRNMGKPGMRWAELNDPVNGMKDVMILMSIEWIILLVLAFFLDHRPAWQPLFLFRFLSTNHSSPSKKPNKLKRGFRRVHVDTKSDVFLERKVVKQLLKDMDMRNMIICHNLKKVYRGKNGNPDKNAVRGLSLALRKGQCFGMLGPNGAGKTSFINMMIGLVKPTCGTAYIHGMNLRTDMNEIYANIGVCPQHDLLWETLSGREHLMFYGRLKNLTGAALTQAVEESLKSVNLFQSSFGDKTVSKYSGGMKRRLSVAIALIGNPKVIYMDEPSTGLDSRSRHDLWNIIKRAKKDCTIILTTHSMQEAEELCDRIGIFINGNFHCIGTPKELKARYGSTRILTITTSPEHEEAVERLVSRLSPGYTRVYSVSGTQKFALPRLEVGLEAVFGAVEVARRAFPVLGWGVADATLEDVFVRVAKEARAFDVLS